TNYFRSAVSRAQISASPSANQSEAYSLFSKKRLTRVAGREFSPLHPQVLQRVTMRTEKR
ncbi:MAG: hypothetical protein ABR607_06495, partial [Pyrinomonadaceae bacterium]